MTQARFSRRLGFLALLAALSFAMTLPALALFDQQAPGEGAPIAQAFSLTTYRDVAVSGTFTGVDPQGEPLTFRVTENPARGSVTLAQEGSARFTYTPYENKTGKDTFAYVAVDPEGNVSQPAEVSVEIRKPRTGVTYADLAGHPAHRAAITLAEEGIFVGEQLGETWFFHPEAEVSREDFLAMAMDLVGLEALPEDLWRRPPSTVEILYRKQIRLGTAVHCFYSCRDGRHQVEIRSAESRTPHAFLWFYDS